VLCKVYGFCEYISFAGNETCMLTSFSNDKMYAIADSVAWLHFAVFFALKKKRSPYISISCPQGQMIPGSIMGRQRFWLIINRK
jgi:hypothetical protein